MWVCLKWTASQTPDVLLTSSVQVKGEILPSEGLELSKVLNRPLAPELFSSGSVRICSARESFWFLCSFRGIWHFLYFRLYAVLSINLMYIYLFFYIFHLICMEACFHHGEKTKKVIATFDLTIETFYIWQLSLSLFLAILNFFLQDISARYKLRIVRNKIAVLRKMSRNSFFFFYHRIKYKKGNCEILSHNLDISSQICKFICHNSEVISCNSHSFFLRIARKRSDTFFYYYSMPEMDFLTFAL